jgi:hypothetical protein
MTGPAAERRNLPKSALNDYVHLAGLESTYLALWILLKEQGSPLTTEDAQALRHNHNKGRSICRDRATAATKAGLSDLSGTDPTLYSPTTITTTEDLLVELHLLTETLIERMANERRPLHAAEWLNVDQFLIHGLVLLTRQNPTPAEKGTNTASDGGS